MISPSMLAAKTFARGVGHLFFDLVQVSVVLTGCEALAHRLQVDVHVVGVWDHERPLHTEVQCPLCHPTRPLCDLDDLSHE